MIRILRRVILLSQLLFISGIGQAQQIRTLVNAKTNSDKLQKLSTEQNLKFGQQYDRALQLAKKHNWVVNQSLPNGSTISLQGLTENGRPIYYETYNNSTSAITTSTNKVYQGSVAGLNLSGAHPQLAGKLGIWDGGAVRKTHQEMAGRVVQRDGATSLNDHATHVAGTMVAKGINPNAKGMSFGALDLQAWNFNNDNSEISGAASGLLVSNHSYGNLAGWRLIGANWYWYGDINVNEKDDVNFGYYSNNAQLWDNIAFNAPYYLMVKAAGNSRNMAEPQVGTPYYRYNPAIGNYDLMPGRTADMRFYNSYDVIPDHSVAKNILTVGAIQGIPNGYQQPSDAVIYVASSWGPTDDGRIKPDLVGNGIAVTSSMAGADNSYNYASGTSMAAPNVTGSLFLLQEHFANRNNGRLMLAATLKGLAIHTAYEAGNAPGPDYIYGWGVMNTEGGARVISNSQQKFQLSELTLMEGQNYTQAIVAAGTEPLRVTISWTDPAGTVLPMIPSTLNNRTPRLINDLDVRVSNNQGVAQPWILDPGNPSASATTGDNIRDNVEQVLIANPIPGQTYTVTISHKGTLKNSAQNYSLIMSGLQGIPYCVSKPTSSAGARIDQVTLGSINNTSANACATYSDYTNLFTNAEIGQVMPLSVKIGTCDAAANTTLKVYADWNEDGDFTDKDEWVTTSGLLATGTTFTTSIAIPATVKSGNSARLRLVLVETDIAETVSSCGTYGKGETEDYILNFTTPVNDLGVTAVNLPTSVTLYPTPDQGVTIKIKNFGLAAQSNFPVSVQVNKGTDLVTTLAGTYTGVLNSNDEKPFTLPGGFAVEANTTYTFTAATALATDGVTANNQFQATITSQNISKAPVISATICDSTQAVHLSGTGNGTLFWYDAATGGNLIAAGNQTTTSFKPQNKIYYAALNQFNGSTALLNNTTAGTFGNTTQDTIYFNAAVPFLLDRVTVNAGAAGLVKLNLFDASNNLISVTELNLIPGATAYAVNLNVPAGKNLRLLLTSFTGGATANRNNGAGTLTFPYAIPNVVTLTKSSTGALYFYNWIIKADGVPSGRIQTKLNGSLTASVNQVCANNNTGTITFNGGSTIVRWEQSLDGLTWTSLAHTQSSYTFANLSHTTRFRAILNNDTCNNIATEQVTVTVNPLPVATITPSGSTKLCAGTTLTLTASPGANYKWSTGETTQTITVTTPGNYTVEVKNTSGCTAVSAVMEVTNCLTTWTGNTDTNWNNTANWSNGIPDAEMDVNVPANVKFSPAVSTGTATCKSLTIGGSLTINGGTVKVNENFTNNGTFNQTSGTLEMAGKGAQKIKGNNFLNLRMGGNSTKTLSSDITVTGSLTVTEGEVNTGAYKIILDQGATLAETSSNYVVGKVIATRSFSKTNARHTFGNMGLALATNASPAPTIEVTRVTGNAGNLIRSVKRQFEIHVISGKTTDLNATMEFTYLPGELNGLVQENLALYRSTDNGATWMVQPSSVADLDPSNHLVTLNGISAFSTWTAADRDPNTVLPVSLVAFKAIKQKDDVLITWETATEKNAAGMEIEVSTNAKNYRSLGFVAATGINTHIRQQYQFTDQETGKAGTRYYRLKQLDQDGKITYYGSQAVTFNQSLVSELSIYPNPSNGNFNLTVRAAEAGQMQLEIINTVGQLVYQAPQQLNKGENTVNISLPAHSKPGIYHVVARYQQTQQFKKLVIK